MAGNMKENGKITTWKELVFMFGTMGGSMKANTKMIRNLDLVFTHGQMEDVMKVTGIEGNNMALAHMLFQEKTK